jgi:hypothetical protein
MGSCLPSNWMTILVLALESLCTRSLASTAGFQSSKAPGQNFGAVNVIMVEHSQAVKEQIDAKKQQSFQRFFGE